MRQRETAKNQADHVSPPIPGSTLKAPSQAGFKMDPRAVAHQALQAIHAQEPAVTGLIFSRWATGDRSEPYWYRTQLERNNIKALFPLDEEPGHAEETAWVDWPAVAKGLFQGNLAPGQGQDLRLDVYGGNVHPGLTEPTILAFKDHKPRRQETAIAARAKALNEALWGFLESFKYGYRQPLPLKAEKPEWMRLVMGNTLARVVEHLGGDLTPQGQSHYQKNLAWAAWAIHCHSEKEMPEKAISHALDSAPTGEGELAEWAASAGTGVQNLVTKWKERSVNYTDHDARVEAYQDFIDIVGRCLCEELRTGAGAVNPNIPLDFEGMPRAVTDLGGYPLFYITKDGSTLSPKAVIENLDRTNDPEDFQWYIVMADINHEDPDLICDHTGERIPSSYREDEATGFPDQEAAAREILARAHQEQPSIIGLCFELAEVPAVAERIEVSVMLEGWRHTDLDNSSPVIVAEKERLQRLAEEMLTPYIEGRTDLNRLEFRLDEKKAGD